MKTNLTLLFALVMAGIVTVGQRSSIELNFTAVNNTTHVPMDSIKIMNRTQGGETILIWPDTVLSVLWVGVPEPEDISGFKLYQNYPNPAGDQTTINLAIPEQDQVNLMITDVLGRTVFSKDMVLSGGLHTLLFNPGKEAVYLLWAIWKGSRQTINILHYGTDSHQQCSVEYAGLTSSIPALKAHSETTDFSISPGNELLFIGYKDILQSGMLDAPEENQTYTFQFATNIPCPGTPMVDYEGQVYNTIQIFSQCWLKENLNVGVMIDGTIEQSNNGTIEKYCYNNEPDSCAKYGGLYQWWEMMQYNIQQGLQGICPPGWHLPTDEEWKVLEGAVDSQYGIGDNTWHSSGVRGFDIGTNLKATTGWLYGGNGTDLFGFSGLPGGYRHYWYPPTFLFVGSAGYWWTSTEGNYGYAWGRYLNYGGPGVSRYDVDKDYGYSVRCLRDY
jgi:uncharacterized protein (TIGR02145 family)